MGKLTSKHLAENTAYNRGDFSTAPVLDLREGGHFGHMTLPSEYISAASYIPNNIVCLLVDAPKGFQVLPNAEEMVATLKSLVEEQARTISGLTSTLTVDSSEVPLGGAGEVHQDISNVTRARTTPSFTWPEKIGRPINLFMEYWIEQLGMNAETKIPDIVANDALSRPVVPEDFLPDFRAMTCLFFEPDPSFSRVVKAWLSTNMFPLSGGENTGTRDLTTASALVEHSIDFTASTFTGRSVSEFAQEMLDGLNLTGISPNIREVYPREIHADVRAADTGYMEIFEQ